MVRTADPTSFSDFRRIVSAAAAQDSARAVAAVRARIATAIGFGWTGRLAAGVARRNLLGAHRVIGVQCVRGCWANCAAGRAHGRKGWEPPGVQVMAGPSRRWRVLLVPLFAGASLLGALLVAGCGPCVDVLSYTTAGGKTYIYNCDKLLQRRAGDQRQQRQPHPRAQPRIPVRPPRRKRQHGPMGRLLVRL
jgi:hypothetical protein